ncbi:hypothetical protein K504DRAFT_499041 [Pleomassaria siparia CBS 279.74]|uniref:Extradiol ring-cleavage dioxygenase class III enzyme subunit B domain-containing protein n=1 Tax=Pleomassaria siparia CBS 279.74 TaxID=1314801 RepID=A0A6G1KPM1_9PLEO|nr:hypothetical protein K504DRAFT_499041 [Pleomassaria siparia CBS 279.74]
MATANKTWSGRTPVYFLGIGGPDSIENTEHPAYAQLATIGQDITTQVKPKAVVVFSAHWCHITSLGMHLTPKNHGDPRVYDLRSYFSFDEALEETATADPKERQANMAALMSRGNARKAYPNREHHLPVYVGTGTADMDVRKIFWTLPERSLS